MGKLPAFLFYPKDWLTDNPLCVCSKGAKGVWADMLCLMFGAPNRGVFDFADGRPWTDIDIAGAIGGDTDTNLAYLTELLEKGVVHRNQRGAIFSRRMVRDEAERQSATARKRKERNVTRDVTVNVTPLSGTATEDIRTALEVDVGSKSLTQPQVVELLDVQQAATFVCMNLGLSGIQVRLKVLDSVASYAHREKCSYKIAAETLVSLWNKYDAMGLKWKKGIGKWFEESEWRNSERWGKEDDDKGIEAIRGAARRVAAANGV